MSNAEKYLLDALRRGNAQGGGYYSHACEDLIMTQTGAAHAYLTPSCTSALEIACMAIDLQPGDEVIMPSFNFPSAANAVLARWGVPVFADIQAWSLNIDPHDIATKMSAATKAVIVMHYGGVPCDMDAIRGVVGPNVVIIEDAAQAYGSTYKGTPAGVLGDIGCFSFHATKNIQCGEGGAIVTKDSRFRKAIEIAREKGTNRSDFLRGEIGKYEWVGPGTSGLPSEYQAAVLLDQLERSYEINSARSQLWLRYYNALGRLPPPDVGPRYYAYGHAGHVYWIDCLDHATREWLRAKVGSTHFEPLHASPAWRSAAGPELPVTDAMVKCMLRLPLHDKTAVDDAIQAIQIALRETSFSSLGESGRRLARHLVGA